MLEPSLIKRHALKDDGTFPNNPRLPLLVYPEVFAGDGEATDQIRPGVFEHLFSLNKWVNSWRNGVYSLHHYHSTAHEVLGVYRGSAAVQFGGDEGEIIRVQAGDVVVIPAGVAHKKLSSSQDFAVVGAYPSGQLWDMNYGKDGERPTADQNILQVALPEFDPVLGETGLPDLWI